MRRSEESPPQRLRLLIPPPLAKGVEVAVGDRLRIPFTVEAENISICSVSARTEEESIELVQARSELEINESGRLEGWIELQCREPLKEKAWITVTVKGGRLSQAAGFFVRAS